VDKSDHSVQIQTYEANVAVQEYAKTVAAGAHSEVTCLLKRQQAMEALYNCQLSAIKSYVIAQAEGGRAAGQTWLNAKDACYETFSNSQDCSSGETVIAGASS